MPSFPTKPDEIDAGWLTEVLRADGALPEGRVVSTEISPVGEPGQTSEVVRVHPSYQDAPPTVPATLIAKFASSNEGTRAQLQGVGSYEREVRFYQQLGDDAGIAVPHAYAAELEGVGPDFVLLTEDVGAGRNGDFFNGCLADVESALDALPAFHARWWQNEALRGMPWIRQPDDEAYYGLLGQLLTAFVPVVEQKYPQRFNGYPREASRRLAERWDALWRLGATQQWTLVHSDYHPKQIFFPTDAGGRFAVFDWQTVGISVAAMDVHRIMVFGLEREELAAHQGRLLGRYHAALGALGVDYPFEQLERDLREALLFSLFIMIFALATTDIEIMERAAEARGRDFYTRFFDDFGAALELNRVIDVLD